MLLFSKHASALRNDNLLSWGHTLSCLTSWRPCRPRWRHRNLVSQNTQTRESQKVNNQPVSYIAHATPHHSIPAQPSFGLPSLLRMVKSLMDACDDMSTFISSFLLSTQETLWDQKDSKDAETVWCENLCLRYSSYSVWIGFFVSLSDTCLTRTSITAFSMIEY